MRGGEVAGEELDGGGGGGEEDEFHLSEPVEEVAQHRQQQVALPLAHLHLVLHIKTLQLKSVAHLPSPTRKKESKLESRTHFGW